MSMKILHISYYYGDNISGAPVAASRLHNALLRKNVDSYFLCIDQRNKGENVYVVPSSKLIRRLFYIFIRGVWVFSRVVFGRIFMTNLFALPGFLKEVERIKPDVIHIHLISQDMVSFKQLKELNIPIVFTLHDLMIANAVEPYPGDDVRFIKGFNKRNSSVIERWLWRRKKNFVELCRPFFTGPSNWVCAAFQNSIIGQRCKAVLVPNILNPIFGYDPSRCIRHSRFTILFGAFNGRKSPLKGWLDLVTVLKIFPEKIRSSIEVCVFGENGQEYYENDVRVWFAGVIDDPAVLRDLHHRVDVFALPSKQDNAPQVKFEALVDGLPVIAFDRTGCAEYLKNGVNGWVAPDGDYCEYARGIEYFLSLFMDDKLQVLRQQIADASKSMFSEDYIVDQYIGIYENYLKS